MPPQKTILQMYILMEGLLQYKACRSSLNPVPSCAASLDEDIECLKSAKPPYKHANSTILDGNLDKVYAGPVILLMPQALWKRNTD